MTVTIQHAIDAIIASIPGAPFPDTVDTLKLGDATQALTGLIVTGHTASEEPGLRWIIPWLAERLPGVAMRYVPTGSPVQSL